MRTVAATQRTSQPDRHGEVREGLDVRWRVFLAACGLRLLPLPNDPGTALGLIAVANPAGILLTGGGDLIEYGGTDLDRQRTEVSLLTYATDTELPLLGVCRGMQLIQTAYGVPLTAVDGHRATRHHLSGASHDAVPAPAREVNSFHTLAAVGSRPPLQTLTMVGDVVESVRHLTRPVAGIMWHPEREPNPHPLDVALFRTHFGLDRARVGTRRDSPGPTGRVPVPPERSGWGR
jgi:putative glutamine amidotransferase